MRRRTIVLSWLIWLASVAAWPEAPKFALRQVAINLPYITAYLEALGENGQPPHLAVSDISSVSLGGQFLRMDQITLRHSIDYVLLLDVSGSIRNPKLIRDAISSWVDTLPSDDHVEIFTVGNGYRQVGNMALSRKALKEELGKVAFVEQKTELYSSLKQMLISLKAIEDRSHVSHVVILVTDGKDEGSNVTMTDVQQEILQDRIPIYTIGYSRIPANEQDRYLAELQSFARASGGFYECAGSFTPSSFCREGASPQAAFAAMKRTMAGIFIATLLCNDCRSSDSHELQIRLKSGAVAQQSVALARPNAQYPAWAFAAAAFLVVIIVLAAALLLRKKPTPLPPPPPEPPPVAPEPAPMFTIRCTIVSGLERGRCYTVNLGETAVIGRDAACDLALPSDQEISNRHCELAKIGKRIEISDLGSTNGTLVNGAQLIGRAKLEDGDLVRVGRTEFRVSFGES
ncbi:MAG TPA: FHA domain-containing protein [Candidatus Angelobacter sp.]|nr:FHA domain-containing protein [Candidatus Angelobacter sp.]